MAKNAPPANPQWTLKYMDSNKNIVILPDKRGVAIANQKLRHKIKSAWKQGNWNTREQDYASLQNQYYARK